MFLRFRFVLFLAIALPCVFVSCDKDDEEEPYDVTVDLQDATFPDGVKYNKNPGSAGQFKEGVVSFQNTQETVDGYPLWYGFAYSQMHDVTTPGYENEFSVYAVNDDESNIFMVGYNTSDVDSPPIQITFDNPVKDLSFDVANTTYAALMMMNGDEDWGVEKFSDGDEYVLTILASSSDGNSEKCNIKLADGTKITNVWNRINFTLGNIVKLEFSLSSTDTSTYGEKTYANTPTYFCIDNITARTVK